jgi:hypothetical protein
MRVLIILMLLLPVSVSAQDDAVYSPDEWYPMWVPYPLRMVSDGRFYAVKQKWHSQPSAKFSQSEMLVVIRGIDIPIPRRQHYPSHDCIFELEYSIEIERYLEDLIGQNQPIRLRHVEPITDIPGYPSRVGIIADVFANGIHVANKMIADGMAKELKPNQPRQDWCAHNIQW